MFEPPENLIKGEWIRWREEEQRNFMQASSFNSFQFNIFNKKASHVFLKIF